MPLLCAWRGGASVTNCTKAKGSVRGRLVPRRSWIVPRPATVRANAASGSVCATVMVGLAW